MAVGQDQKPRIVGDKLQPPLALLRVPADPCLATGEVITAGAPTQQRDPAAAVGGDVADLFADHRRRAEIMLLGHQLLPAVAFPGADRAHDQAVKHLLFGDGG